VATKTSEELINTNTTQSSKACQTAETGRSVILRAFKLAIDPLQRIIETTANRGILKPVLPKTAHLRCSLHADDAGIFARPKSIELQALPNIYLTSLANV
jgi:hypothetical protein